MGGKEGIETDEASHLRCNEEETAVFIVAVFIIVIDVLLLHLSEN